MTKGKLLSRSIYLLLPLMLLLGTTVACEKPSAQQEAAAPAGPSIEISLQDFDKAYKADQTIHVLDVRTPMEYEQYHVQTAHLLPLQDIQALGHEVESKIPFSKEDTIYVICRSGNRSFTATKILRSLGYKNAVSVAGGTAGFMQIGNECSTPYLACQQ